MLTTGYLRLSEVPPPCTLYYLATCYFQGCTFAHDYDLKAIHIKEIRETVKRAPCPAANKGQLSCPLRGS